MNAQVSEEIKYGEQQYVVFTLGEESFGVDINKVREIIVYRETTNIPGTTDLVEGIINLRGKVIPIYSLRKKFGFPEPEGTRNTRIVVIEVCGSTVGVIVDGVSEVLVISGDVMEKPSSMICQGVDSGYIDGIAKIDNRLIIILDLEKVISSDVVQAV
ncbi:MAG: chemotaxis protein CheW [Firmicutes bacterium HGW-Firmicutes-14]|jgi:purine-binding chemotaxis protein CheW|nr:MAG: chemotaxis protein CheW [Firmicutes bacterium HGW-Firmicutes-14]